ncbi:hypothetical protein [Hephaestia caeni]|uniref:hypothetical protein n=1 Tax=Hephaestia caeni TaxID=645617 RepID=UPI0011C39C2E|nr:hypothetical protein [Hephaestia caeni]
MRLSWWNSGIKVTWARAPLWWKASTGLAIAAWLILVTANVDPEIQIICFAVIFFAGLSGAVIGLRQNGIQLSRTKSSKTDG